MFQEFKRMPEPLQRQTLLRLGLSALFLVLTVALAIVARDIYLLLPCAGAVIFFAAAAFLLFRRVVLGEYVIVSGECAEVGLTVIRRRAKHLVLQTDACRVKVILRSRLQKISAGTKVNLYVANNAPIYDREGVQMLYSYLAIDIIK